MQHVAHRKSDEIAQENEQRLAKARHPKWKCVGGHDRCDQMLPNEDCPYCERTQR